MAQLSTSQSPSTAVDVYFSVGRAWWTRKKQPVVHAVSVVAQPSSPASIDPLSLPTLRRNLTQGKQMDATVTNSPTSPITNSAPKANTNTVTIQKKPSTDEVKIASTSVPQKKKVFPKRIEPATVKDENRHALFPLKKPYIWEKMYKVARALRWEANEFKYNEDKVQFDTVLTPAEKHLILTVLAFFAPSDLIVNESLAVNFLTSYAIPELRALWTEQMSIENVHTEVYSLQLNALCEDETQRQLLFRSMRTIPVIKAKDDWMLAITDHNDREECEAEKILCQACSEWIFFSSSFAVIYWFKGRNLLPNISNANELINRDEAMHVETSCHVWNEILVYKPTIKRAHEIIMQATNLEIQFVHEALKHIDQVETLNTDSMIKYVKYMADRLCGMLKLPRIYEPNDEIECPLEYMTRITLEGKSNNHERVGTAYRRYVPQ